jgi:hypothetical protein
MSAHAQRAQVAAEAVAVPERHPLRRTVWPAAAVGVAGMAAFALLAGGDPRRAWAGYLVAFFFFLTVALGGLFFVLVHHVTRAGWGVVVRRLAEHLAATLPLFALLFAPLALGAEQLFPWFDGAAAAGDELLAAKAPWLAPGFFWARAALYLGCWGLLAWWFRRRSLAQDAAGDPAITRRLQALSAPALLVFAVTITFASFDWIMSLDPHWYSTIFGVYVFAGSAMAVFATLALAAMFLERGRRRGGPLAGLVNAEHYHDLGKLLFAFVVFWAYIAFSQFMLIWYGNLPEETVWYAHRWEHGWRGVSIALAVVHFAIPFFALLPRATKRRRGLLAAAALWLLAAHYLDLYWLVMPAVSPESPAPGLAHLAAFAGVGGLFVAVWARLVVGRAVIPLGDPRLAESLSFENM